MRSIAVITSDRRRPVLRTPEKQAARIKARHLCAGLHTAEQYVAAIAAKVLGPSHLDNGRGSELTLTRVRSDPGEGSNVTPSGVALDAPADGFERPILL
jgi:hypothetical protein